MNAVSMDTLLLPGSPQPSMLAVGKNTSSMNISDEEIEGKMNAWTFPRSFVTQGVLATNEVCALVAVARHKSLAVLP
jgi:hypothetical protein